MSILYLGTSTTIQGSQVAFNNSENLGTPETTALSVKPVLWKVSRICKPLNS